MDRYNKAAGAAAAPTPPAAPTNPYYTAGNPGGGIAATQPGEWFFHMMTEELRAVIVEGGLTPSHTNLTQLRDAIRNMINGGDYKPSCRAATTANIASLAGGAPNTLDGVTLVANDRILVKDQTTGSQNGIYYVSTLGTGANGTWTRATDADTGAEFNSGAIVAIEEGAVNADTQWMLTTDGAITIGTTALTFIQKGAANTSSILGAYRNLKVDALGISNYNCVITADEVVLENSANQYFTVRAVNKTVNANGTVGAPLSIMSARAASTWYYRWLWYNVANGLTATLDTSSTAPTAPTGYSSSDYKTLLPGACRTDASGNTYLLQIETRGKRSQYVVLAGSNTAALPQMASGTAGNPSTPTWVSVATGNFVPPTASILSLVLQCPTSGTQAMAAPNNSYGAVNSTTNPPPLSSGNSSSVITLTAVASSLVLESTNIYWASTGSGASITALGWEDNI